MGEKAGARGDRSQADTEERRLTSGRRENRVVVGAETDARAADRGGAGDEAARALPLWLPHSAPTSSYTVLASRHRVTKRRCVMSVKTWLATTRHGLVHATCDAHERWSVAALLTDQMVTCLAADPLNRAVVYAGTQGNGVLRSADGGQTWHPAGLAGAQCHPLSSLAFLPGTNSVPLPDARSVYLDPNPLGRDLAAANKMFSQQQRVVRCKSPQVVQREH